MCHLHNAKMHADAPQELQIIFTSNRMVSMTCDLIVAWLLIPEGLVLNISVTADLLFRIHTQQYQEFAQNGVKNKNE